MAKKNKQSENQQKEANTQKELKLSFSQMIGMYQQQKELADHLSQQEKNVMNLLKEAHGAKEAVSEIKNAAKNTKILVPLGIGIFAEANLAENKSVKAEIGGSVFERMTSAKAIDRVEERTANLNRNLRAIREKKQKTLASITQLEKIISDARQKQNTSTAGVS